MGKLVGFGVVIVDLCVEGVFFRVWFMVVICFDLFLNFGILVFDKLDVFVVLVVFVGDFILDEVDFFGEILDVVYLVV